MLLLYVKLIRATFTRLPSREGDFTNWNNDNSRIMKNSISVIETLIWHDSPQLFVAKDTSDGFYICLAVDDLKEVPLYISVAISPSRLQLLKAGKIVPKYLGYAQPRLPI